MYNNEDEAKHLLAQALSELKVEGEDWRFGDYYLALVPDSTGGGSHWATSVTNEKTSEDQPVNFNIEPADGVRENMGTRNHKGYQTRNPKSTTTLTMHYPKSLRLDASSGA
jgi:hypothetical protein